MNDDDFQVYRGVRGDLLVRRGHIWLAFNETQAVDVANRLIDLVEGA